ncbi:MAG: hypothetical protein Q8N03_04735 [Ignavibacteria bacterium]|nr:hypothetical protein [Ignavibacteria bacterium]
MILPSETTGLSVKLIPNLISSILLSAKHVAIFPDRIPAFASITGAAQIAAIILFFVENF